MEICYGSLLSGVVDFSWRAEILNKINNNNNDHALNHFNELY